MNYINRYNTRRIKLTDTYIVLDQYDEDEYLIPNNITRINIHYIKNNVKNLPGNKTLSSFIFALLML